MSRTLTEAQGFDEISKYETIKAEDLAQAGPFYIQDARLARTRYGERIVLDIQLVNDDPLFIGGAEYALLLGNQPFRASLLTLFADSGEPVGPCVLVKGNKPPHAWFVNPADA
jgi:hypothetical protein